MSIFDDIYKAIMKAFVLPDDYVVDAAKLKCNYGTITTLLYIPPEPAVVAKGMGHPSQITGKIEARENDAEKLKNIKPFGDCKNKDNKPCRGLIEILEGKWKETNEEHLLEGQPTVTLKSFLSCKFGGKITPLDSGQNNIHPFDQELEELDNVIRQYEVRIVAKNFGWFLKYDQMRRAFWSEKDNKGNPKYNTKFSRDQALFREKEIAFAKDENNKPPDVSADIKEMMAEIEELPIVRNQKDHTLAYTMVRFTQMVNTNQPMDFKSRIYKGSGEDAEKYSYKNILAGAKAAGVDVEKLNKQENLDELKKHIEKKIGTENVYFNEWSVLARPFKDDIGLGSKDGLLQHDDYGNFIYGQVGAHVFANGERSEAQIRGLLKYGAGVAQFGSNLSNAGDSVKNDIEEKEHYGELEIPEYAKFDYTEYVTFRSRTSAENRTSKSTASVSYTGAA